MTFDIFELSYILGLLHRRKEELPTDKKAQELIDKIHQDYPELEKIIGTTTTHPNKQEKPVYKEQLYRECPHCHRYIRVEDDEHLCFDRT